jgi:hypothetical protein
MSTSFTVDLTTTNTTPDEKQQAAIRARAEQIITGTVQKHGITRDKLTKEQIDDAHRAATEQIEREAARASNPYYAELEAEREKNRILGMQVAAMKQTRTNSANNTEPAVTVEMARRRLGDLAWIHQMTDAQRLSAIGVPPESVTPAMIQEIKDTFGPGSSHRASDLMKANAGRYRTLREINRCLRIV